MSERTWALCAASLLSACVGAWPGTDTDTDTDLPTLDEINVGFLYVGPVGDHGWTKSHDDGRLALEAELGVSTFYEPSVLPADAVARLDEMVAEGGNVLFTTSFDFVSATQQAASNHPEARFFNCSGGVHAANLSSYMGRMFQPMYLAGIAAGETTCTDRIGIVSSIPIPETVRHINAFTLGARKVNPDVIVEVKWVFNWFDPVVEPVLTDELIDAGSDIIVTQTDTTIPMEATIGRTATCNASGTPEEVPVYSIGYDNIDACSHAPEYCLTAAYWNWGPVYIEAIQAIVDGTWDPTDIGWKSMKATPSQSSVGLSEFNPIVPGSVRLKVDAEIPDLLEEEGSQLPFHGPLRDTAGAVRYAAGESMDDDALNRMCWFVDGVVSREDGVDSPAVVPPGCGGDI